MKDIPYLIVKHIYADHNSSALVRKVIKRLLDSIPPGGTGLNIGAGRTRISDKILNMEIEPGDGIDLVGSAESIPAEDECYDLVICQEVLEHVRNPAKAMEEIKRVLKTGGRAYIQLPFIIGYHPCPKEFWRFSREGVEEICTAAGLEIVESGVTVGSATGFYRIAVEFFALLFSLPISKSYRPFKFLFALILYPIKLLDPILALSPQRERISGGFYVVAQK